MVRSIVSRYLLRRLIGDSMVYKNLGFRDLAFYFINEIFSINKEFVPYMLDFSRDRKNTVCVRYYEYRQVNGEWFESKRNTYLDLSEDRVRKLFSDLYSGISSELGVELHSFKIDVNIKTDPSTLKSSFNIKDSGEYKGYGVFSLVQ